jgi:hypothetical protein
VAATTIIYNTIYQNFILLTYSCIIHYLFLSKWVITDGLCLFQRRQSRCPTDYQHCSLQNWGPGKAHTLLSDQRNYFACRRLSKHFFFWTFPSWLRWPSSLSTRCRIVNRSFQDEYARTNIGKGLNIHTSKARDTFKLSYWFTEY